ncbi:hypothetical protein D3C73_828490 [compost metagenome]
MARHLLKHLFQHQAIQPRCPAETLEPRQEPASGNRLALLVDQPRQYFVMQHQRSVLAGHHRLEIQLEPTLVQRLVEQAVPGVMIVGEGGRCAVIQAHPP